MSPLRELSVLVVDDNAVNRMVAVAMLKTMGCVADVACDGQQAIDAMRRQRHDLVLMDCEMPGMDGFEATRLVRALERAGELPAPRTSIVALTAHALEGTRDACLAAGMDDYLSKPVSRAALAAIVAVARSLPERASKSAD